MFLSRRLRTSLVLFCVSWGSVVASISVQRALVRSNKAFIREQEKKIEERLAEVRKNALAEVQKPSLERSNQPIVAPADTRPFVTVLGVAKTGKWQYADLRYSSGHVRRCYFRNPAELQATFRLANDSVLYDFPVIPEEVVDF